MCLIKKQNLLWVLLLLTQVFLRCNNIEVFEVEKQTRLLNLTQNINRNFEASAVVYTRDQILVADDKNLKPGQDLVHFDFEKDTAAKSETYVTLEGVNPIGKIEAMGLAPDESHIIISTAFDRIKVNKPKWDHYNKLIYWDLKTQKKSYLYLTNNEGVLSSRKFQFEMRKVLGLDYFKIEGLALLPKNIIIIGIREEGASYKHFDYKIKLLFNQYRIIEGTAEITGDWQVLLDFKPPKYMNLGKNLGVSSIEYDRFNRKLWMLTSFERKENNKVIPGGYLWYIPEDQIFKKKKKPILARDLKGKPIKLEHKAEGLTILNSKQLLIVHDDDRIVEYSNWKRDLNQAPYTVLDLKPTVVQLSPLDSLDNFYLMGNSVKQYLRFFGVLLIFLLGAKFIRLMIKLHVKKLKKPTGLLFIYQVVWNTVNRYTSALFFIFGVLISINFLNLPKKIFAGVDIGVLAALTLIITMLSAKLLGELLNKWRATMTAEEEERLSAHLFPLFTKVGKFLIYVMGFLIVLSNSGYNVYSILAGLSVVGFAVAMAAREAISHIFSGVSIYMDHVLKEGDYILLDKPVDSWGIVEKVGLRSTRIITKYETTLVIPNSELANKQVNNVSAFGNRRMFKDEIILSFNNSFEDVEKSVENIRIIIDKLEDTEEVDVHFYKYDSFGYFIRIQYWIKNFKRFYDVAHELNLKILKYLSSQEITFASPLESLASDVKKQTKANSSQN